MDEQMSKPAAQGGWLSRTKRNGTWSDFDIGRLNDLKTMICVHTERR